MLYPIVGRLSFLWELSNDLKMLLLFYCYFEGLESERSEPFNFLAPPVTLVATHAALQYCAQIAKLAAAVGRFTGFSAQTMYSADKH